MECSLKAHTGILSLSKRQGSALRRWRERLKPACLGRYKASARDCQHGRNCQSTGSAAAAATAPCTAARASRCTTGHTNLPETLKAPLFWRLTETQSCSVMQCKGFSRDQAIVWRLSLFARFTDHVTEERMERAGMRAGPDRLGLTIHTEAGRKRGHWVLCPEASRRRPRPLSKPQRSRLQPPHGRRATSHCFICCWSNYWPSYGSCQRKFCTPGSDIVSAPTTPLDRPSHQLCFLLQC